MSIHRARIFYTNYKGETRWREIEKLYDDHFNVYRGIAEWYPQEQWLMDAYDVEKKETRTFAMRNIKQWE